MAMVKGSDDKARYVLKSVHDTEKNMAQLRKTIDTYLKTHESFLSETQLADSTSVELRGKSLKLALALKGFSETETPNLGQALLNTAEAIVDLEEYRKYMHDRIEVKATEPLKLYKVICKNLKEDVKNRDNALVREHKKHLELDKMNIKDSTNRSKITQSQLELDTATADLGHVNHGFAENVERFHVKKTGDLKSILFEMIYSEMGYHAKALEALSNLQNGLFAMDMDSDVYEIREKIRSEKSADI